ncbi:MAG: HAD family hydrolase [Solobacterium sp.]|jgi:putative hydrolase of the HAD superfamily|nr:HAD family hydrolase [Solobacterium sp.]MCH4222796.1 HAD family hydrolase [Solobacterium sp.]MCH4266180.1 HAD family hydrolase [Solobacterium sp.]
MIKGILFDFDGTLSNRVESAYFMYRYLVHCLKPEMDIHSPEFEAIVQKCMLWDEFGTINKRHVLNKLKENYCPDMDVEKWAVDWYEIFPEYQVEQPDCYRVLEELKQKYRLGVVSNGDGPSQAAKIDMLDLRKYFETVIISHDFGVDKPDVSIYDAAAKALGLKPEECAFIGDTFATDILGAVNAGMKPIWYCFEHYCVSLYDVQQLKSFNEIEDFFLVHDEWNH